MDVVKISLTSFAGYALARSLFLNMVRTLL